MSDLTFRQQVWLTVIDKFVIAAIVVVIALAANERLELFKTREQNDAEKQKIQRQVRADETKAQLDLIQRQLNDLYYPLYFRLAKDDATWDAILSKGAGKGVEETIVVPNNKEVLSLIEGHPNLIFRPDETREPALIKALLQYERHMAVYLGLRATGDTRRPADLGVEYPSEICRLVEARVSELEAGIVKLRNISQEDIASGQSLARLTECARARRVSSYRAP